MNIFNNNIILIIILSFGGLICPEHSLSKTNNPKSITFSWGRHILNADDPFRQGGFEFDSVGEIFSETLNKISLYKLAYRQPFYHDNIDMRFEIDGGGALLYFLGSPREPSHNYLDFTGHYKFLNLEAGPLLLMRASNIATFRFGGGIGLYKEWISFTTTDLDVANPVFPTIDKSIHFGGWFDMGVEFGPRDKMRIELFFKYNRTTGQLSDNTKTFGVGLIWPFGKLK